jgi:hypothetical protein
VFVVVFVVFLRAGERVATGDDDGRRTVRRAIETDRSFVKQNKRPLTASAPWLRSVQLSRPTIRLNSSPSASAAEATSGWRAAIARESVAVVVAAAVGEEEEIRMNY